MVEKFSGATRMAIALGMRLRFFSIEPICSWQSGSYGEVECKDTTPKAQTSPSTAARRADPDKARPLCALVSFVPLSVLL